LFPVGSRFRRHLSCFPLRRSRSWEHEPGVALAPDKLVWQRSNEAALDVVKIERRVERQLVQPFCVCGFGRIGGVAAGILVLREDRTCQPDGDHCYRRDAGEIGS
jgi:hypothetical protein